MSAAPKGRNILAQGAALGRKGPSPRLPFDFAHGSTLPFDKLTALSEAEGREAEQRRSRGTALPRGRERGRGRGKVPQPRAGALGCVMSLLRS
jgi:hypothetical protein